MSIPEIFERAYAGERVSPEEGLKLLEEADLFSLGALANHRKEQKNAGKEATFVIDRNINYTNICIYDCSFCGFYRKPGNAEGYVWSKEEIFEKIEVLRKLGGTQVLIQGGVNPNLSIDWFVDLFQSIRDRFPEVHIHSLSPVEIEYLARREKMTLKEVLLKLKDAGLASVPGGGAEILVDRVREIVSPRKTEKIWFDVMRTVAEVGLKGSASMVYGMVETPEERIAHLVKLRQLQDETNVFRAFICWSFKADASTTRLQLPESSGSEYLRMIAISRIMLDNFDHVQAGWLTETVKLAQLALAFGADDMGGILLEDEVMGAVGVTLDVAVSDMVHNIKSAGRVPVQRNTKYEHLRVFN